jgi:hypothetical protein
VNARLTGVVFVSLFVAACGALPPSAPLVDPAPTTVVIPIDVAPGTGLGSGPEGGCGSVAFSDLRLEGDPDGSPPVWVVDVAGGPPLPIRWPPGFSARLEPLLVIYNARRQPVARAGDVLMDASGYPSSDAHPATLFSFNGVDYPCE